MQNGTYTVKHKVLNNTYKLICYNGNLRLTDFKTGNFIRTISQKAVDEFYEVSDKGSHTSLYDIAVFRDGKKVETIRCNMKYTSTMYKIGELKRTTHKTGLLVPIKKI